MITDAIVGLVLAVVSSLLGVMPVMAGPEAFAFDASQIAVWLGMANVLFPLGEVLQMLGVYFGLFLGVMLFRFVIRIKPW